LSINGRWLYIANVCTLRKASTNVSVTKTADWARACRRAVLMSLAVALLATLWPGTGRAAGSIPIYTSLPYHYSVSYPTTWTRIAVKGADFSVVAPDRNAIVSLSVARGEASLRALTDALKLVYPAFGKPDRPPFFGTTSYVFAPGAVTYSFVIGRKGARRYIYASNFSYLKHLYTLVGAVVDVSLPTTSVDYQQMRYVATTLHISS
jgi:hypothetical protein